MSLSSTIAIIGLGYVGLPLAVALARSFAATGFDINPERIAELRHGLDRTREVAEEVLRASTLRVTDDAAALPGHDCYIVTVPTPVDARNLPDLSAVLAACRTVGTAIAASPPTTPDRAPIVVFESTVYPGVTEDICGPALEAASGRKHGTGFRLGYSPERINPGDREHTVERIVKVVAGSDEAVTAELERIYGALNGGKIFRAKSIKAAEAAKVIENAQRDINIAFVNEVAMICQRLNVSVYDVLEAAGTKWNFLPFRPGLVGGHCIGVDPFYLAECARKLGQNPEVIIAGRRINDCMGAFIANEIVNILRECLEYGRQARVLVLGLTFKENVPDLRNSKVMDLIAGLRSAGHVVDVHDPHADPTEAQHEYGIILLKTLQKAAGYDAVVGAVPHAEYVSLGGSQFATLLKDGGLVADIKGMWRATPLPPSIRRWEL